MKSKENEALNTDEAGQCMNLTLCSKYQRRSEDLVQCAHLVRVGICGLWAKPDPPKLVLWWPCGKCAEGIATLIKVLFARFGPGGEEHKIYHCDRCGALYMPGLYSEKGSPVAGLGARTVAQRCQERGQGVDVYEGDDVLCLCGEYNDKTKESCGLPHKTWCPAREYEQRAEKEWEPGATMPAERFLRQRIQGFSDDIDLPGFVRSLPEVQPELKMDSEGNFQPDLEGPSHESLKKMLIPVDK